MAEKLGFRPDHVIEQESRPLLGDTARTHAWLLERERWERDEGRASGPGRAADPANETSL